MKIGLSERFTFTKLLRFVFPSIIMMVFTSIYNVVDGFFVSNFVGKASFAAVNLIMPLLMIGGAIGFMIGTGGSALAAKLLGAGEKEKANRIFSLLIYTTIVISQCIGGLIPLAYFIKPNKTPLRLTKTRFDRNALFKTFTNGSSELMSNISMSVVSMLYNFRLIRFAGENGVASYGVIMYIGFVFSAIFFGYMLGSSPIVSYHFGAGNRSELKNIFRKSIVFIAVIGIAMTTIAVLSASKIAHIFVGYDEELRNLTIRARMQMTDDPYQGRVD